MRRLIKMCPKGSTTRAPGDIALVAKGRDFGPSFNRASTVTITR